MSHDVNLFQVGEIINPDDWGLQLEIVELHPATSGIVGRIVKAEYLYSSNNNKPFWVGQVLTFEPGGDSSWKLSDSSLPWYVLGVYDGRKRFEHYR